MLQLTLAARYLLGRRLRTGLTTLAVVFGVFILFGMNVVLPAFVAAFQANILAAYGQVDASITHRTGEAFSPAALETVKGVGGVRAASGSLGRTLNLPGDFFDGDPARLDVVSAVSLVGLDPEAAQVLRTYSLESGRFLEPDDRAAAVITVGLAGALGLHTGDSLALPTARGVTPLTIVGLRPARTAPGNEEVLVTLPEAQELLDRPGQINLVEADFNTTDEAPRAEIARAIQSTLGDDYHLGALSTGTELFASLRVGQFALNLFGFLAIVMGGFIIFNSFRTVVVERRRDLALLRAVGASRRTVLSLVLAEGLLQGSLGTLAGMAVGYLLGAGILALVSSLMEQYVHLRLGGPVVTPGLVILTIGLGVGVTVLAGLLPALSASKATPLEALRPVDPETRLPAAGWSTALGAALIAAAAAGLVSRNLALAGLGGVCCLLGLILIAPALVNPIATAFGVLMARTFAGAGIGSLAQANLSRQPARAAITASTTMIALAIIVAAGGTVTSITEGIQEVLRKSLGSDYLFIPPAIGVWGGNVGASHDLADRLRALDGVDPQGVSTFRFAASSATSRLSAAGDLSGDTTVSLVGLDPVAFPRVSGLRFEAGEAATAYGGLAAGRAVVLNGAAASTLGLHLGDGLCLATLHGLQAYRVVGIANDYFNAKIVTGYVSQADLAADFDKTEDVFIQLNLRPGAAPAEVEPQLRAIAAGYPQFRLVSGPAYVADSEQVLARSFSSLYFVFALLAIPSLIALLNTLAIGVIERTREIGMLRAVGATRSQMGRLVVAEALLLTAIGAALGLLAGLYLGYVIVSGLAYVGFSVPYVFPLSWLLTAAGISLIFGLLAAFFPARQAARLEIVQALRYE